MFSREIYGDWILDWQFSAPSFEDSNKLIYGNDKKEPTIIDWFAEKEE